MNDVEGHMQIGSVGTYAQVSQLLKLILLALEGNSLRLSLGS